MDMIDVSMFGLACFAIGIAFGAWLAWRNWLHQEKPVLNITIDPQTLHQINAEMVAAWLDERGLTWMAKGAVFDPNRKASK